MVHSHIANLKVNNRKQCYLLIQLSILVDYNFFLFLQIYLHMYMMKFYHRLVWELFTDILLFVPSEITFPIIYKNIEYIRFFTHWFIVKEYCLFEKQNKIKEHRCSFQILLLCNGTDGYYIFFCDKIAQSLLKDATT